MTRIGTSSTKKAHGRQHRPLERRLSALTPLCFLALLLLFFFAGESSEAVAQAGGPPLNLPSQIGGRIARCWQAPQRERGQVIEVTVRLRFQALAPSPASRVWSMCALRRSLACGRSRGQHPRRGQGLHAAAVHALAWGGDRGPDVCDPLPLAAGHGKTADGLNRHMEDA